MNGSEPATKADLAELKAEIKIDLSELKAELTGEINSLESRLTSRHASLESRLDGKLDVLEQRMLDRTGQMIHDSETRLLQAFYGFAETNNKRLLHFDANDVLAISRLSTLESRVLQVEKRLNIPPA